MNAICTEEMLIDALPHGSGIDCTWNVTTLANGNMVAHNSYHGMDDGGYYDGWQDFSVKLYRHTKDVLNPLKGPSAGKVQIVHRKGDVDFTISFNGDRCCKNWAYGLKDYLYDTVSDCLSEAKLTTSRQFETVDA